MTYQPSKEEMSALLRMVQYQASKVGRSAPDVRRDDLISEGNLALTMALRRYDPSSGASTWTFTEPRVVGAMQDLVQKHRRPGMGKRNKGQAYTFDEMPDDFPAPQATNPGDAQDAAKALQALLNPVQEVVVRERMQGCSFAQIGEKLGISRNRAIRIYNESLVLMRTKLGVRTDI